MDSGTIALRYAKALFAAAGRHGEQEQVYRDAVVVGHCFEQYPSLKRVISNRTLSSEKKAGVVAAICGKDMSGVFRNFIRVVLAQRREEFLQSMCLSYRRLVREDKNLMDAVVTTAVPMGKATGEAVRRRLEELTGKKVTLKDAVDPSIMGGFVLRWDTYRLDASVKTSLKRIRESLMEKIINHDR